MKITHVKGKPTKVINVVEAAHVDGYRLRVTFDDGVTQLIDFEPFLRQARNPMTTKYLDLRKFKQFKIEWGNLSWNDHEMIFPIMNLYRGKIEFTQPKPDDVFPKLLNVSNGNIRKSETLILPTNMVRRLKARAKKEDIPVELLIERYLEESIGRHSKRV